MELGRSAYIGVDPAGIRIFTGLKEISEDGGSARYYWMVSWPEPAAALVDEGQEYWLHHASSEEMHACALEKTRGFKDRFTDIVRMTGPEEMLTPPLVIRDLIPQETPLGRVALVGDAAHSMSPFRGEGGNHAMMDAVVLAGVLAKAEKGDVREALKEYEREMVARTKPAVEQSREATQDDVYHSSKTWGRNVNAERIIGDGKNIEA